MPGARPGGMGADFRAGLTPRGYLAASAPPVFACVLAAPRGLLALLLSLAVCLGIRRLAKARLGGMTGDVQGLAVEVSEVAVLLAYAAR